MCLPSHPPTHPSCQILPSPQHPCPRGQRGPVPRRPAADGRPRRPGGAAPLAQIHRHPAAHGGPPRQAVQPPVHPRGHKVGPRRRQAHQQGHPGGGGHLRLHRSLSQNCMGQITPALHICPQPIATLEELLLHLIERTTS